MSNGFLSQDEINSLLNGELNNDNEVSFMSKIDYIDKGFDYVPF